MTLDGSIEWVVLIDAKQRQGGKFWVLLKGVWKPADYDLQ